MLYLLFTYILNSLISHSQSIDSYCGLLVPNITEDCTQYSNEYYTCCYVEFNFTAAYSPKACYGVVNAANVTFPKVITEFSIINYDCGLPKPKVIQDSMLCGNNVTSTGPADCFTSSNKTFDCCEFTYDNIGVCVNINNLGSAHRKLINGIVCESSFIRFTYLILIYILLV
jgi:hypothetical protein